MPAELKRLEALLRRGARAIDIGSKAHTWCRTKQQLLGHGVRKELPWKAIGILTKSESEYLSLKHQATEEKYKQLLDSLEPSNVTINIMRDLPAKNSEISRLLREVSAQIDNVIRGRFSALVKGMPKKQAQAESKRPIKDRIEHMDLECRLSVFHPLFLKGRIFRLTENILNGLEDQNLEAMNEAKAYAEVFVKSEPDPLLKGMAQSWFDQALIA
jgi:hypothetical protein